MGALNDTLQDLRRKKRKALAIFITAGDPSPRATPDLVAAAVDAGADIIELGVPFSDPLADGPVIQRSFMRAIGKGTTLTKTIEMAARIHDRVEAPLVFMIASTLVVNHGAQKFMRQSAKAGISGVILPDVPPEEAKEFVPAARGAGLDTVFLAAPTSTPERLRRIAELSSGFVQAKERVRADRDVRHRRGVEGARVLERAVRVRFRIRSGRRRFNLFRLQSSVGRQF